LASKKAKPAAKKTAPAKSKPKVAKAAQPQAKPAPKAAAAKASTAKASAKAAPAKAVAAPVKAPAAAPARAPKAAPAKAGSDAPLPAPAVSAPRRPDGFLGPLPDKPLPRATKLPADAEPLTKREMEQVLTVGVRGVVGEGSLKGRLLVYQGFPYLEVIGRDKRELWFILQGPDQEVLPAYADHRVSVVGLVRRSHNYGGSVEVRKYAAKKPEAEVEVVPVPDAPKLRALSPGEVETIANPGMSVGVKGFATLRGRLESAAEDFFLVVSNIGTRQQVTFMLEGKGVKGLKRHVGQIVVATGVVEKTGAWGGRIETETVELRAPEFPPVSRETIDVSEIEASGTGQARNVSMKVNHGLSVKLSEKQGYIWAVEPQTAKRVSLREVNVQHPANGSPVREFFFTPRNPGLHEVEFFLGKAFNPMNVARSFKVVVDVKAQEQNP
jgi:hypothetical protein